MIELLKHLLMAAGLAFVATYVVAVLCGYKAK